MLYINNIDYIFAVNVNIMLCGNVFFLLNDTWVGLGLDVGFSFKASTFSPSNHYVKKMQFYTKM